MLLCTGEGTAILPLQKYNRTSFPGQVSNRCEYSTPHYSQEDVRTPECRACLRLSKGQLQLPPLHAASTFHLRPPHLCQENPIHSGVKCAVGHHSWWHQLESELHCLLGQNSKGSKQTSNSFVKGLWRTQIYLQLLGLAGKDLTREQQEEHGVHVPGLQKGDHISKAGTGSLAGLCCRNASTHTDDTGVWVPGICVNHKTPTRPGCKGRSPCCCLGMEEELPHPIKTEMTLTAPLNNQRWLPTGWVQLRLLNH